MGSLRQFSFVGGELDPSLHGRADLQHYNYGLKTCKNFLVMRQGGVRNRPGMEFVKHISNGGDGRFIPFIFNNAQTYMILMHEKRLSILKDRSITYTKKYQIERSYSEDEQLYIELTTNITSISGSYTDEYGKVMTLALENSNFILYNESGKLEDVELDNLVLTEDKDKTTASGKTTLKVIKKITGEEFDQDIDHLENADAAKIRLESTYITEYTTEEVKEIDYVQSADILTIVSGNHRPAEIRRDSTEEDGELIAEWKYKTPNFTIFGDSEGSPGTSTEGFRAAGYYPKSVEYFQQRLVFANIDKSPEAIFMSSSRSYYDFNQAPLTESQTADDAVEFLISARRMNEIVGLLNVGRFIIFTTDSEWYLDGSTAITPTNIKPVQSTYSGCSTIKPIPIGSSALYIQARGSQIRDLVYDFQSDNMDGVDLTVRSAHLFDHYQIVSWAYQQTPHSITWAVRSDGILIGLTYIRSSNTVAWHRHETEGKVLAVGCIPEKDEDVVYILVERVMDGKTRTYIETMAKMTYTVEDHEHMNFTDSSISYNGRNEAEGPLNIEEILNNDVSVKATMIYPTPKDWWLNNMLRVTNDDGTHQDLKITAYVDRLQDDGTPEKYLICDKPVGEFNYSKVWKDWGIAVDQIHGLAHLNNTPVSVFADRYVLGSPLNKHYDLKFYVIDGVLHTQDQNQPDVFHIFKDKYYMNISIGIPFTSDLETLDLDLANNPQVHKEGKLVKELTIYIDKSRGIFLGAEEPKKSVLENMVELKTRTVSKYKDKPELISGAYKANIKSIWNGNGRIFIRQVDPLPINIRSISPDFVFSDFISEPTGGME